MQAAQVFDQLRTSLQKSIVGQAHLVERLLISLLADGHLLVEGAPGLAKTKAIKALSDRLEGDFQRIQFTPDLLPSDVTGTEIYRMESSSFEFQPGPIFHNLILADEINRAPAKVQSALLEAMAERQVSVGKETYPLDDLFLVMATQNPIEQEGTYPLPEAQLDRFLLHVKIDYPSAEAEKLILRLVRDEFLGNSAGETASDVTLTKSIIKEARKSVLELHMSEAVEDYIVALTMATREPAKHNSELARWIDFGVSPRGTLALDRCARAHAWLQGKDFVSPDDVSAVLHDVFRHRVLLSYEAEAEGKDIEQVLTQLLNHVPVA